jgi:hypothetical protein
MAYPQQARYRPTVDQYGAPLSAPLDPPPEYRDDGYGGRATQGPGYGDGYQRDALQGSYRQEQNYYPNQGNRGPPPPPQQRGYGNRPGNFEQQRRPPQRQYSSQDDSYGYQNTGRSAQYGYDSSQQNNYGEPLNRGQRQYRDLQEPFTNRPPLMGFSSYQGPDDHQDPNRQRPPPQRAYSDGSSQVDGRPRRRPLPNQGPTPTSQNGNFGQYAGDRGLPSKQNGQLSQSKLSPFSYTYNQDR